LRRDTARHGTAGEKERKAGVEQIEMELMAKQMEGEPMKHRTEEGEEEGEGEEELLKRLRKGVSEKGAVETVDQI
jgi:hypothetical protein